MGTLSRMGKGVTLWNLMLDDAHKPYRPGGCSTCWGAVTLSSQDHSYKAVVRNSHYYNVAHCSKVLHPGAVRIGTSGYTTSGLSYLVSQSRRFSGCPFPEREFAAGDGEPCYRKGVCSLQGAG